MLSTLLAASVIAYLLGSIPFGLILVRLFRGVDVRQTGSGNIGTANVARLAPGLGLWTLILDSAKGYLAIVIAKALADHLSASKSGWWQVPLIVGASAVFVIVGHMFPIFLRFKGGKGVATAMGAFLAIAPLAVLIVLLIYVLIYAFSHYTSLASITSAAIFPFIAAWLMKPPDRLLLLPFLIMISSLIIIKHHQNIRRLLAGTENRLDLTHHQKAT
jgi:glycerol-3-phosphate acyltransferase PlsY